MILLPTLLILLTGCAGRDRIAPPDWSIAELPASDITEPTELPQLCEMVVIDGADGERYGTWSPECWKYLQNYEIISEANADIAQENANALRNTEAGYNALLNAGKLQRELGDFYLELYEDEKSGRFMDSVLYRALIGLGFIVVML